MNNINMLELVNKEFQLNPDLMLIPEFRRLWERDKSKDKSEAYEFIAFIFHFNNPKSAYYSYQEERRKDEIIQRVFPESMKKIKPKLLADADMINASNMYLELLQLSPYRSVIDMAKTALQNITNTLNNTEVPIDQKLSNIKKITMGIEELKKAEKLCEEDEINSRVKGQRRVKAREI